MGEFTGEDLCMECLDREQRGFDPTPVYPHGAVERHIRYLYVLKLDGGIYYVGQTNDLTLRAKEHADGLTTSTRGKHPKLVWFQKWIGRRGKLNDEEDALTHIAINRPRALRLMIEEWQRPLRLVDLEA